MGVLSKLIWLQASNSAISLKMKIFRKPASVWLCVLFFLLSGCRNYEITDLGSSLLAQKRETKNTLLLTAGIVSAQDQSVLKDSESCVEVTLQFSNALAQSRLFDRVLYPLSGNEKADLILRADFERSFDLHRGFNTGQNLLLLASGFLLYPFLKLKVDYTIRGTVQVLQDGNELRTYRGETGCRARMHFLAPVEQTADALSARTMRRFSEELTEAFVNDQDYYLGVMLTAEKR